MRRMRRLAVFIALFLATASADAAPARHPGWLADAVVYGVIPGLAGPHGLADVTKRLDDIADLGATVIWLSPIAEAPPGDFGYAVTDPFHIRASLGTEGDLHALVRAAHRRGLKVILDIPANHLSDQHPYYRDAMKRGTASPYYRFFDRDAAGEVTHYFDWRNLENLDYAHPEVRAYVTEVFAHWLKEFDIDGFRVDAAWGPRQRAPGFWPGWVAAMRRIKPDILLLAEASERDRYYAAAGFDAAYDWTDKLGEWAWQGAFDGPTPALRLRAALASEDDSTPIFRFLDNNDTGARFITRHGPEMTRAAAALLMTLPGLPAIYMGEEVGAEFEPYRARAPLAAEDHFGLHAYFRRLVALRHREAALRSPKLILLRTSAEDAVLAYIRPGATSDQDLVVAINFSAGSLRAGASLPPPLARGTFTDLLTGERITLDPEQTEIPLPPFTARILRRTPAG
jgi:cyclomaltodextrinase